MSTESTRTFDSMTANRDQGEFELSALGIATFQENREGEKSWKMNDQEIQSALSSYSVDDVEFLLDELLADTSVKKKVRRRAVGRVVQNQPHKTIEFKKYDRQNQMVHDSRDTEKIVVGSLGAIPSLLIASSGILMFFDDETNLIVSLLIFLFTLLCSCGIGVISFHLIRNGLSRNEICYRGRNKRTLEEFNEWEIENKKKGLEAKKSQLAQLAQEISGEESTISVSGVKKEYENALARIASYELDFEKSLKYPAFNNILVPETQEMIKQMRACKNRIDSINASNVDVVSGLVDELWVKIQVAEETAKSISTSTLSKQELALFETARGLFAHASDSTYSDDVRANYYRKLKSVVDALNERRTVIPTKIVAQIEAKSTAQIEAA